jgi:SAM-dependent methyltransferase
MNHQVGESRFWDALWRYYPNAPSIALCRVPELEYASTLNVNGRVLDHGCGDGRFASLAWPGRKLTAGCDINPTSITLARARGIYNHLDVCDAARCLPWDSQSFDLVFDNSALEHIEDLDAALAEIARVLAIGGVFAFNVLNHRYFEWWPLSASERDAYRQWQPFFHALSLDQWRRHLARVGLEIVSVHGYLDQRASREFALLDYAFSRVSLGHRHNLWIWVYDRLPLLIRALWRSRLSSLVWETGPDAGAGYFLRAVRCDNQADVGTSRSVAP